MNKIIIILLLFPLLCLGALPEFTTVWEVRPTNGNDTNGGAFVTGSSGIDMSQFNSSNFSGCTGCYSATVDLSTTDVIANNTTTLISNTMNGNTSMVGNIIYLQGGTGSLTAGWYQIISFTSNVAGLTTFVVDRNVATGTGITMNIGGALKTLTKLNLNLQLATSGGGQAWVKAESVIQTASQINFTLGGANPVGILIEGYTNTRGDGGQVTIQATANSFTLVRFTSGIAGNVTFVNFIMDCQANVACGGITVVQPGVNLQNINVISYGSQGGINFNASTGQSCRFCYVTGAVGNGPGIYFFAGETLCYVCVVYSNTLSTLTSPAFKYGTISLAVCTYCIAANNNGNVNVDGFGNTNAAGIPGSIILINCIGYNNGRDGVRLGVSGTVQTYATQIINSIFVNNAGYGINNSSGTTLVSGVEYLNYNSFYNNTLGNYNALPSGPNDILTLTSDPFVNGASNNFILNNTINSGAALKNVGYPGVLTIGGTGYLDIGTLQHISTPTPTGTPINR